MSGDSHTGFNSGAFTMGAVGGALSLAAAVGAGWANHRAAQQNRWHGWDLQQMQSALDYTDDMLRVRTDERDEARRRVAEMERFERNRSFAVRREHVRSLQAPR